MSERERSFQTELGSNYSRGEIIGHIAGSPLWNKAPEGICLYVDLTTGERTAYRRKYMTTIENPNAIDEEAGIVILASPALIPEQKEEIKEKIRAGLQTATNRTSVFLIEQKGKDAGKDWRDSVMAEVGLVKRGIRETNKGFLIWSSRVPKERIVRPVDLLVPNSADSAGKAWWRDNILPGIIRQYEGAGYRVDVSEIEEALRNSTNHPDNLEKVGDGFGVKLTASCGCCTKIDLEGTIFPEYTCQDHIEGSGESIRVFPQTKYA